MNYELLTRIYQGTKILDLRKYTQHDHMPNRWSVSGRMVGPVSVWGPFNPHNSSSVLLVSTSCSECRVCTSCHLCQIIWNDWWLFWFPALIHPLSAGSRGTLSPAGQMGSSCWTPSDSQSLCCVAIHLKLFQVHRQYELWITSYSRYLSASQ